MISIQLSFGQGLEKFDAYPHSGTSYSTSIPDWAGVNGITWSLNAGGRNGTIDGVTPLLGTNGNGGKPKGGILTSTAISNGIGNLSFKYRKAFSSNTSIAIFINDVEIETISVTSQTVNTYTKEINVEGDFTFKFETTERTLMDDVEWTPYGDSPTQSSAKAITSFTVDGKSATIDESAHTLSLTVPASANLASLSPTIEISAKASILPASGSTVDFTNPVTYTVTAEDGSTQAYEVTIDK